MGFVFFGSCSNKQTIVGTWTDIEGYKWVFSVDGKLKYDDDEYKYSVFDGERGTVLTIFEVYPYLSTDPKDQAYNVYYSRDGKTIRLAGASNIYGWSVAGPGWGTNELTRQPNPIKTVFTGTWSCIDPDRDINIQLIVEGTTWTITYLNYDYSQSFTATYNGNSASIDMGGETGTATVSKNSLTWTVDGVSITFTKQVSNSESNAPRLDVPQNIFGLHEIPQKAVVFLCS